MTILVLDWSFPAQMRFMRQVGKLFPDDIVVTQKNCADGLAMLQKYAVIQLVIFRNPDGDIFRLLDYTKSHGIKTVSIGMPFPYSDFTTPEDRLAHNLTIVLSTFVAAAAFRKRTASC